MIDDRTGGTDGMPRDDHAEPCPFTTAERGLIRRELGMHFGSFPAVTDGILLRTWRSGPRVGEPKIAATVQTMLDRGLVEIRRERLWAVPHSPKQAVRRCVVWFRAGDSCPRVSGETSPLPKLMAQARPEGGPCV